MRQLQVSLVVLMLGAAVACRADEEGIGASGSDVNFSFIPRNQPFLKHTFDLVNKGQIPICISHVGLSKDVTQTQLKREGWVRVAFEQWLSALYSLPEWKGRRHYDGASQLRIRHMNKLCPHTFWPMAPEFSINFFETVHIQVNSTCRSARFRNNEVAQTVMQCSTFKNHSLGEFITKTIIISPLNGTVKRPLWKYPETVLHEVGHVFGLYESYKDGVRVNYTGRIPSAIMAYTSKSVTADDVGGLKASFRYATTGEAHCGENKRLQNRGQIHDVIFCELVD